MAVLRTERLRLSPVTIEELAQVNAAANGACSPLSAEAVRWASQTAAGPSRDLGGGWSFRHRITHRLVGLCLYARPAEGDATEISYLVTPDFRRRGFCVEALGAVVAELLGRTDAGALFADVAVDNLGSLRVLDRLGFALDPAGEEAVTVGLDRRPAVRMRLTPDAWRERRNGRADAALASAPQASGGSRR